MAENIYHTGPRHWSETSLKSRGSVCCEVEQITVCATLGRPITPSGEVLPWHTPFNPRVLGADSRTAVVGVIQFSVRLSSCP